MAYMVEVTQEDIRNGKLHDVNACPIALACKRAFDTVFVEVSCNLLTVDGEYYSVDDWVKFNDFVEQFDEGEYVNPFTFKAVEWSIDVEAPDSQ